MQIKIAAATIGAGTGPDACFDGMGTIVEAMGLDSAKPISRAEGRRLDIP